MSSWVAPSVAAELWGVSIEHVLAGVANGSILSYVDGQFLFVDITGRGEMPNSRRTPTQQVVTGAEIAALTFVPREAQTDSHDADETSPEDDEPSANDVSAWRTAREQSARIRRPPNSQAA